MMKSVKWLCSGIWLISLVLVCFPVMAGTTWQQTGGPTGGSVECLAIDPASHLTVYAGTLGGVYKSADGGGSWTAINNGLPNYTYV